MRLEATNHNDVEYRSKYEIVRDHLRERIAGLAPGDQLPPEPALCEEYAVSRITVRRAVDDLIRDGLLVREQGRGTFVVEPVLTQQVRETFADKVTGFYRQQVEEGREVTTEVLGNQIVKDPTAAAALGTDPDAELIALERLRYVNGFLHQHVVTFLSAARFPRILVHDFSSGSLFDFLELTYGVSLTRNDLLVRLEQGEGRIGDLLGTAGGETYLAIESTVFSDDQPVAFGIARHTPRNSEIAISLRNAPALAD